MEESVWMQFLTKQPTFRRQEYYQALRASGCQISDEGLKKRLEKAIKEGAIIRCGRDCYSIADQQRPHYNHSYSELACQTAELLRENHPYLDFSIFELIQLNEFVNHQIAHNTVFVSAENDVLEFLFDSLRERFPGKVLISPTPELYHQYWVDNMIVLTKLISEAPKGSPAVWYAPLEKILVDLIADPLLKTIVGESEYPAIFAGAATQYMINEGSLLRYARRRTVDTELLSQMKKV